MESIFEMLNWLSTLIFLHKRFKESRSRRLKDCVHRGLGRSLNKQKTIRSTKVEWMVFRICNTDALLATTISTRNITDISQRLGSLHAVISDFSECFPFLPFLPLSNRSIPLPLPTAFGRFSFFQRFPLAGAATWRR